MHPSDKDWPRCACGCGEPVPVRKASNPSKGRKVGEPCKFVAGHSNRVRRKLPVNGRLACPRCSESKPVEAFHRDSARPSGYHPWCRECQAAKAREHYKHNRERLLAATIAYHEANPEVSRAARARHQQRPEYLPQARMYASAYRARKREQFVEDVDAFVVYDRDEGVCGICGEPVDRGAFHVDHVIPLSRGGEHSYANVQVAHGSCNNRKYNKLQEEMAHA